LDHDDYDEDIINRKTNLNCFNERWISLDSELILNDQGQICQTCNPTGHSLLICTFIEFPSDLTEEESQELTEKLEILHEILDKKVYRIKRLFFFFCILLYFVVFISQRTF
jgi:hypothetical protein